MFWITTVDLLSIIAYWFALDYYIVIWFFQVLHQDLIVYWCQAMLCLILWQIWYTTALTPWKTLSESALKVDDTLCIKVRKISIVLFYCHCLKNEQNDFRSNLPFWNCTVSKSVLNHYETQLCPENFYLCIEKITFQYSISD